MGHSFVRQADPNTYHYTGIFRLSPFSSSHPVEADEYEPGLLPSEQAASHRQSFSSMEFDLGAAYGITDVWDAFLLLPLQFVVESFSAADSSGTPMPGFASVFHTGQNFIGLGDVEIATRYRFRFPEPDLDSHVLLLLGLTVPLGSVAASGMSSLASGSGTWDPLVAFEIKKSFGATPLLAGFQLRTPLGGAGAAYYAGMRSQLSLGVETTPIEHLVFSPRFVIYHEAVSKWGNVIDRNTGRTDAVPTVFVEWKDETYDIITSLAFPFNLFSVGGKTTAPFLFSASFVLKPEVLY